MRERRGLAVALIGSTACAAIAWGVVSAQAGCTLQNSCDPSWVFMPATPKGQSDAPPYVTTQNFQDGAGMYGPLWQSSPIEGQWMNFPGQRTYLVYPQLSDGGPMVGPYTFPEVDVSADQSPLANPNSNYAPSAGNIAEFSELPDGGATGFAVTNNTCTPYYLFLKVAQEYTPDAATTD